MEGETAVEYKTCPMCGKQIEASKFRMHEMGCIRQNYICPKCKKCVAKSDKEEHDENECEFSENVIARKKAAQDEEKQKILAQEAVLKEEQARQ